MQSPAVRVTCPALPAGAADYAILQFLQLQRQQTSTAELKSPREKEMSRHLKDVLRLYYISKLTIIGLKCISSNKVAAGTICSVRAEVCLGAALDQELQRDQGRDSPM
jgi:hypothetical protein